MIRRLIGMLILMFLFSLGCTPTYDLTKDQEVEKAFANPMMAPVWEQLRNKFNLCDKLVWVHAAGTMHYKSFWNKAFWYKFGTDFSKRVATTSTEEEVLIEMFEIAVAGRPYESSIHMKGCLDWGGTAGRATAAKAVSDLHNAVLKKFEEIDRAIGH